MQRIPQIDLGQAPTEVAATLDAVRSKLGMVPNIFTTMAQSPAALNGYLALSGALGTGRLSPALREQIALAVAGVNACDYCACAHAALGKLAGLSPEEIRRNLVGGAADSKAQAAITFARTLVIARGVVGDMDLAAVKAAGYSDGEVLEILGNVIVNLFTNYFNHVAATVIDFPRIETPRMAH